MRRAGNVAAEMHEAPVPRPSPDVSTRNSTRWPRGARLAVTTSSFLEYHGAPAVNLHLAQLHNRVLVPWQ